MTYEHKIHKMLSIRMKAEQFTDHSRWKYNFSADPWKTWRNQTHENFTEVLLLTANE